MVVVVVVVAGCFLVVDFPFPVAGIVFFFCFVGIGSGATMFGNLESCGLSLVVVVVVRMTRVRVFRSHSGTFDLSVLLGVGPLTRRRGRTMSLSVPPDRIAISYKLPYVPQRKSVDNRTLRDSDEDDVLGWIGNGTNGIQFVLDGSNNFIPHRMAMEKCPPCA